MLDPIKAIDIAKTKLVELLGARSFEGSEWLTSL